MSNYNPDIPDDIISLLIGGKIDDSRVVAYRQSQIKSFLQALTEKMEANDRELQDTLKKISQEEKNKAEAAAQGDRSENAEYHAAIENLDKFESLRVVQQERQDVYKRFLTSTNLRFFFIMDNKKPDPHKRCWVLVPDSISDVNIGALSMKSPVGSALAQDENLERLRLSRGTLPIEYTIWR